MCDAHPFALRVLVDLEERLDLRGVHLGPAEGARCNHTRYLDLQLRDMVGLADGAVGAEAGRWVYLPELK